MESQARTLEEMKTFRKRPRVLMRFFQRSRDKWKRKCRQAKADIKVHQARERDWRKSRDQWREKAEQHGEELERLRAENARLKTVASQSEQALRSKARRASH